MNVCLYIDLYVCVYVWQICHTHMICMWHMYIYIYDIYTWYTFDTWLIYVYTYIRKYDTYSTSVLACAWYMNVPLTYDKHMMYISYTYIRYTQNIHILYIVYTYDIHRIYLWYTHDKHIGDDMYIRRNMMYDVCLIFVYYTMIGRYLLFIILYA